MPNLAPFVNMANTGSESFPVPPKRPTIVRPDTSGPTIPARPAPPVPGGRPPPPTPSRLNDASPAPAPAPAIPRRPPPATVPNKPDGVQLRQKPQPSKPPERPTSVTAGSVRKKPEITIVCARPMSEVGFRSEKGSLPQPSPKPELPGKPPPPSLHNASPTPQRAPSPTNSNILLIDFESDCVSPLAASPDSPKSVPKHTEMRPPPPKPAHMRSPPAVLKREVNNLIETQEKSPPSPSRRPVPPPAPRTTNTVPLEPGAKPPRIPSPKLPSKTWEAHVPSESQSLNAHRNDTEQRSPNEGNSEENLNSVSNPAQNQINTPSHFHTDCGEEYAVINKLKRPTIIRPGRNMVPKEATVDKDEDIQKPVRNPPVPSPRMARKDQGDHSVEKIKVSENLGVSTELDNTDAGPEFLRLKLKSTVEQSETINKTGSNTERKPEKAPPPVLSPKPKPGVLPKPQIMAKPTLNKNVHSSQNKELCNESVENKFDEKLNSDERKVSKNEQTNEEVDDSGFNPKPSAVKRPTIIRPLKSQSVEKLNSSESSHTSEDKNKIDNTDVRQFLDDSNLRPKPRSQPPLPNKRPVSMTNIPKSVQQDTDEFPISKSMNFVPSYTGDRPKPVPRPSARSRPVSAALPNKPPTVTADQEKLGLPPRPQHRPSGQNSNKIMLGELVSSQLNKSEISDDNISPSKPARRPPPPNISPKTEEKEASETDIKKSPQGPPKPDRPSVRPPPPKASPKLESKDADSSEEEFHSVGQEPARPPPPSFKHSPETEKPQRPNVPSPRKSSVKENTESEDDDKDSVLPEMRSPKPEARPPRPLSSPVKINSPPRPKPAKPGSMAVKKTGAPDLPSRPGPGHPLYHHMMKAAHGVAIHDFPGQHGDDLSFKAGEVIILVKSVDAEWLVGKVGEREGMFPRSFVKVKIPLPGESPDEDSESSSDNEEIFYDAASEKPDLIGHGPRCRARFDFDGEGPEDLVFEDGDVIKLLERVGPEWRKGELNGKIGLFPLSFVEIIEDLPADGAADETSVVVKAMFDYDGQDDELSFQRGDTITVQYKVNDEWLYGECGGRKGQFPVPFVDHMPANLPPFPVQETTAVKEPLVETKTLWEQEEERRQLEEIPSPLPQLPKQSEDDVPYCVAIYDFLGETPEDLSFAKGDRIELLEHVGDDWLKGSLHGNTGLFPTAFVEVHKAVIDSVAKVHADSQEKAIFGVAQYDFKGESENELTFEAGTRLKLLEKVEGAEDWQWGELNGHKGMFPAAFVQPES